LELKKYEKCLQNIQWALENQYPSDKVEKLLERKEKCEELLKKNVTPPDEDLNEFFKLSYPSNPKIPFIIEGLEVRNTKKFGRGIFTTRDLKPGDIISSEEPVLTAMAVHSQYSVCCNCLTSKQKNLIPCLKTASLMFCSIKCREEIYRKFKDKNFECLISEDLCRLFEKYLYNYEDAFGGRESLIKFIKENNLTKWKKTVFDYDFGDRNASDYNLKALKSILSYYAPLDYKANKKCNWEEEVEKVTKGNAVLKDFLEHMGVVWGTSVMSIINSEYGSQQYRFHMFSPLINYSCFPNINRVITDARIILYVTRPIKPGEQLFRGVASAEIFEKPPEQRRAYYRLHNCFYCDCFYCEKGYTAKTLPLGNFLLPIDGYDLDTTKKKIEKTKETFKVIERYEACSAIGTYESFLMGITNNTLMNHLGNMLEY
jgi:hypothetical protein